MTASQGSRAHTALHGHARALARYGVRAYPITRPSRSSDLRPASTTLDFSPFSAQTPARKRLSSVRLVLKNLIRQRKTHRLASRIVKKR